MLRHYYRLLPHHPSWQGHHRGYLSQHFNHWLSCLPTFVYLHISIHLFKMPIWIPHSLPQYLLYENAFHVSKCKYWIWTGRYLEAQMWTDVYRLHRTLTLTVNYSTARLPAPGSGNMHLLCSNINHGKQIASFIYRSLCFHIEPKIRVDKIY